MPGTTPDSGTLGTPSSAASCAPPTPSTRPPVHRGSFQRHYTGRPGLQRAPNTARPAPPAPVDLGTQPKAPQTARPADLLDSLWQTDATKLGRNVEKMLQVDRGVQELQEQWIGKVSQEHDSLERILGLVGGALSQANTAPDHSFSTGETLQRLDKKVILLRTTLSKAAKERHEVIAAAETQRHSVLANLHHAQAQIGTDSSSAGMELQGVHRQFRTLHTCNQKIIKAAQSQVSAMHAEYQQLEEEFSSCIGDSLTRMASPPGSPGNASTRWERAYEESDDAWES